MTKVASFSLNEDVLKQLSQHAKDEELSKSWIVNRAIKDYLSQLPERPRRRVVGRTA